MNPDYDGWYYFHFPLWGSYLLLECRPNNTVKTFITPKILVSFAGRGKYGWNHPDAIAMAMGVLTRGEPLHPLLDWLMENVELCGSETYGSDGDGWRYHEDYILSSVRAMLTNAVESLHKTEAQ